MPVLLAGDAHGGRARSWGSAVGQAGAGATELSGEEPASPRTRGRRSGKATCPGLAAAAARHRERCYGSRRPGPADSLGWGRWLGARTERPRRTLSPPPSSAPRGLAVVVAAEGHGGAAARDTGHQTFSHSEGRVRAACATGQGRLPLRSRRRLRGRGRGRAPTAGLPRGAGHAKALPALGAERRCPSRTRGPPHAPC